MRTQPMAVTRGRPVILLNKEKFRRRLDRHAGPALQDQARFLGVSRWTIPRLLKDDIVPGETAIASILAAVAMADGIPPGGPLGDLFDELFGIGYAGEGEAA